ncbi:MAG: leucyl/phenylalanyl-tRNA--protein transferase [Rhodanobacter sp.]
MIRLPLLDADLPGEFPAPRSALTEPNGLLAFGGDLSAPRLLAAYSQGIFPWFGIGEPILWWSPDPRCVMHTDRLRINRSLRRQLAGKQWRLTVDLAFARVMRACAEPRDNDSTSWITPDMIDAYVHLHTMGYAHSVEVWEGQQLVGGIYGLAVGRLFCGESMFSAQSGGSKLALIGLAQLLENMEFPLIDTQVANDHTLSLGAEEIPRPAYLDQVTRLIALPGRVGSWAQLTPELMQPCSPRGGEIRDGPPD